MALAGLLTATAAHAEWTFETDFNDDYPDGTEVYGTTVVEWIDDDAEDGVLQLTLAEGNQNGSWIVDNFSEGQTIVEWTGILQTATSVNGPWVDINDTSPLILKPENLVKQQYARARQP